MAGFILVLEILLLAGVAAAIIVVQSQQRRPRPRYRAQPVRARVQNIPVGAWIQTLGERLPELPFDRIWHSRSGWSNWWVVCSVDRLGPFTPDHLGDRWDHRRQRWVPAKT